MNFNTLTVRGKLCAAFGLLSILVLLVAGLSWKAISDANATFTGYLEGVNSKSEIAQSIRMEVDSRAIAARNLVLVTKPSDLADERTKVLVAHKNATEQLENLKKMIATARDTTERSRKLVSEIDAIEARYGPVALAIVDMALNNKHDEAIVKMNEECRPLLAALIAKSTEYDNYTKEQAKSLIAEAAVRFANQRNMLIAACAIAFLAAAFAGFLITRSLTKALGAEPGDLGATAQRVAKGDLSLVLGADSAPAGSVLASLGAMQANLAEIVGKVRGASDSIATGATQIATGNIDLSQRTEEQASALQQTASTMEELGTTVRHNADNANQANQLAMGASEVAVKGGDLVNQVVGTMKGINDSSKKIADIIGVIDSIAFQTNILALNAAVEAARAGEQGRGFAVVASEVRNLAQRCAQAAKEIKSLITASVAQVEEGSALVDRAGETMQEIVASIRRVTDIMGEISAASREQSTGVTSLGQSVAQMDQVTQQNAALVEESAAAAQSLQLQAEQLVQAVSVFSLPASGISTNSPSYTQHGWTNARRQLYRAESLSPNPSFDRALKQVPNIRHSKPRQIMAAAIDGEEDKENF